MSIASGKTRRGGPTGDPLGEIAGDGRRPPEISRSRRRCGEITRGDHKKASRSAEITRRPR
eukprot:3217304-Prymnesium_polylepis.1